MISSSSDNPGALASITPSSAWVIDSGATDHVTDMQSGFHTFTQRPLRRVKIADGTFTPILGKGSINVSPDLSLFSVLHVPSFSFNPYLRQ